ncbi:hypothetical protein BH23GEM9_BH23GEM9_02320 [soil metagenome]
MGRVPAVARMNILLTDILTCPRCGPAFGLILLTDRTAERRVLDGVLGCANCREKYPVRGGAALFAGPLPDGRARSAKGAQDSTLPADAGAFSDADSQTSDSGSPTDDAAAADSGQAMRLAALMGVTGGPAFVMLAGPAALRATEVAGLLEGVEIVAAAFTQQPGAGTPAGGGAESRAAGSTAGSEHGVNRMTVPAALPFAGASFAGVVLSGPAADALLEEGARVTTPLGRLVLEPAPADAAPRLTAAGFRLLLHEGSTVIAGRH